MLAVLAGASLSAASLGAQAPAATPRQENSPVKPAASPALQPAPAFREVTDEAGRRVRLPLEIRRIVSLAPSLTETLYALGAGDRLVGITDFCDYPAEALSKQRIGGPVNPSLEQIAALRPDLILAQANSGNRRETVDALERLGFAVYATDSRDLAGIFASMLNLARIIGSEERGLQMNAGLRARLDALQSRLAGRKPRRAFFVVWPDPLITVGRKTFLADAMRLAGAEPAIDLEQDWPRLSLEKVVEVQPEVLIFASAHDEETKSSIEELRQRPGWRVLNAIRENRVVILSDAVNRPAPRLIDCIEQLARQLHPQAFEKPQNGRGANGANAAGGLR